MDRDGEHRFYYWIDGRIDTQFDSLINLWEYKIRENQPDPPAYSSGGCLSTGITYRQYTLYLFIRSLLKNDTDLITEKFGAFTFREQVISAYLIAASSLFIHQESCWYSIAQGKHHCYGSVSQLFNPRSHLSKWSNAK
jgi:hypothetical protein|tara:strand:- start:177 stop:590 length:414 start_codon:yes stop_codon:yes gene_type:complete